MRIVLAFVFTAYFSQICLATTTNVSCIGALDSPVNQSREFTNRIEQKSTIDAFNILNNSNYINLSLDLSQTSTQTSLSRKLIRFVITTDPLIREQLRKTTLYFNVEWRNVSHSNQRPEWQIGERGFLKVNFKSAATPEVISMQRMGFQNTSPEVRNEIYRGLLLLPNGLRQTIEIRVRQQNRFVLSHSSGDWRYTGQGVLVLSKLESI